MQKDSLLFFDTEFTSLTKEAELISIGIVTDKGRQFYAELNDFDRSKCTQFVQDEVLPNLQYLDKVVNNVFLKTDPYDYRVLGNHDLVKRSLIEWLKKLPNGQKVFVGDVVMWDWILLHDLLATETDDGPQLPKSVHYIPTDFATLLRSKELDPDVDRQEYCGKKISKEHHALEDAKLTMWCWQKMHPET